MEIKPMNLLLTLAHRKTGMTRPFTVKVNPLPGATLETLRENLTAWLAVSGLNCRLIDFEEITDEELAEIHPDVTDDDWERAN